MENKDKIILHLCCSEFGSDTRDYKEAGYDVRYVDENDDSPWGVLGRTLEDNRHVKSYGCFATKREAKEYVELAWSSEKDRKNKKIAKVLIILTK